MKKTRQLFSLILAGMMLLSVVSAGAFADGESGVILMGINLSENVYYTMGSAGPEACAPDWQPGEGDSYAVLSSDGTLILHNFRGTYFASGEDPTAAGITVSSYAGDLTIRLEGENEILSDGCSTTFSGEEITCRSYGIYAPGKSITFYGDGSLKVTSASLDGVSASYSESSAITADRITAADMASVNAFAGNAQYSFGFNVSSLSLSGAGASLTANASTAAFSTFPVSGEDGYEVAVSSDYNQGLTGAGQATVMLAEPYTEPEPEPVYEPEPFIDSRVPGIMPGIEYCSVQACTTPENYDGAIILPEGWQYEWRIADTGEYQSLDGSSLFNLAPGFYQVRLKETDQNLASEPITFEVPAYTDNRVPGIMPGIEYCSVQACTTPENYDGAISLPEGWLYEWRIADTGEYQSLDGSSLFNLAPGFYQVRLKETDQNLASEPITFEVPAYTDSRLPGIMPPMEKCYVQNCTTSDNIDGYIWLPDEPQGVQYQWRSGTEGEYQDTAGNGVSALTPGVYQVRLKETDQYLASEPLTFEVAGYTAPAEEKISEPVSEDVPKQKTETIETVPQTAPDEPSPSPEIMQVSAPAVPDIPITEDVVSVTVSAAPAEKKKISANIKLDTGDNALKAADTLMTLTCNPPLSLEQEKAPSAISFIATGSDSGYLSGTDLKAGLKYKIGENGTYFPIESLDLESHFLISDLTGECTIFIINPGKKDENGVDISNDSDPLEIKVAQFPAPSAEEVIATNATQYSPEEGSLFFKEAGKFAYRLKDSTDAFQILTGYDQYQPIHFACRAGTYEIRTQYKENILASESVYLTIKPYNAPNVSFNADSDCSGSLGIVTKDMEYRRDKGEWCKIDDKTDEIYFTKVTKGSSIEVCYPETGAITEIILDRQEAPDSSVVKVTDCTNSSNNNGTITLDAENYTSYEIRLGSSGSFTPITAPKIIGLTNGTYQLRTKASGNKLASNLCNAVIKEYIPPRGIDCQTVSIQPYEKIFDTTDGYSTLTVSFYPYNTTNQTVTFSSSNEGVVNFGSQSRTVVGSDGRASIRIYPVGSGEAKITATTVNGKTAVCSTIVSFEYRFTYNKSGTWYYDKGGDYTVQTNGPMSRFSALKINGSTVNPQYYTTRANSDGTTILTISQYAMRSLSHGAYQKLQLVYNDGGIATTFLHILSVNDKPITGDEGNAVFWAATGLSSLAALAAVSVWNRKAKRKKDLL